MSITGMLQSVLASHGSYSTQSSSKQTSAEQQTPPSSTTGDTVSLSAQSVSVTISSELGDYDLSNITPDDLDYMSAQLYNNGIISKEQFLTLGSIAFYHKYANGHAVNPDKSPFDLLCDLSNIASGNYESLSTCTWNGYKNHQSEVATSLLNLLTDLDDTTIAINAESVSAELTTESVFGNDDLTNITPDDARILANALWQSGVISIDEMITIMIIADDQKYPYAPGVEGTAVNDPFNLLDELNKVATGSHERLSASNHQWTAFDPTETCTRLLDILTDLEDDTSTTIELDYSSISLSVTA